MQILTGTSGFSYKEWKGSFYPEDLSNDKMLSYYSERLPAVEINNTFYRLPRKNVLESWSQQVPSDFKFVLKASRRITHFKRLKETGEETGYLLETSKALEENLGVILFQLPPNLKKDITRLEKFLELIPKESRATFEFRHDSWLDDETYDTLRPHNIPICISDTDENEGQIVSTASWGYIRMRRTQYKKASLKKWIDQIHAQKWDQAFVFFKHEDAGAGPKLAASFLEIARKGV